MATKHDNEESGGKWQGNVKLNLNDENALGFGWDLRFIGLPSVLLSFRWGNDSVYFECIYLYNRISAYALLFWDMGLIVRWWVRWIGWGSTELGRPEEKDIWLELDNEKLVKYGWEGAVVEVEFNKFSLIFLFVVFSYNRHGYLVQGAMQCGMCLSLSQVTKV